MDRLSEHITSGVPQGKKGRRLSCSAASWSISLEEPTWLYRFVVQVDRVCHDRSDNVCHTVCATRTLPGRKGPALSSRKKIAGQEISADQTEAPVRISPPRSRRD